MVDSENSFLQRLLTTFRIEADEHYKAMSDLLLQLEQTPALERRAELLETLFREAHSLKGAARAVDQSELEEVSRELESMLSLLKRGELKLSRELFDDIYRTVDEIGRLLKPAAAAAEPAPPSDLGAPLDARNEPKPLAPPEPSPPVTSETVRISTAKLSALLNQTEELLMFKFSSTHLIGELTELSHELAGWKKNWSKAVRDIRALRRGWERHRNHEPGHNNGNSFKRPAQLDKVFDAMERDELRVKIIEEQLLRLVRETEQERHAVAGLVDGLLADMKQTLMLPFASLLELFPKLVRDQARDSGKEVDLKIEGANIEIDRRILEQMKDPLIHLMRNSIDHGIEAPAERAVRNKAPRGTITIAVSAKDGNKIELIVADDGGGIKLNKVRQAAERLNLLGGEEVDEHVLFDLVFESGLSTSPILTDISGRGLGLAIVREKVEKLGGRVDLESQQGAGTQFRILLPSTLATFRGLLVEVGEHSFVLPSANVERAARLEQSVVKTVENRETIELEGQALALVWLADVLELTRPLSDLNDTPFIQVVVLEAAGKRIAFAVDRIIADQEVLVKHLGPQLPRVRNVAAATVLGAGRVVPILNVLDLMKSAVKFSPPKAGPAPAVSMQRKSLLVVEDSITSRSLLKSILESNGYDVITAVDGIDALTTLRTGQFDLVVSDVEMPRMDGFDLTAKIRQEPKLRELPVVLVTALDSREDKERGIDVGADAYIVKSSFDQSNLLEVIRRLT
jgi:two-component system chemotaxis sensor kinase CheA